MKKAWWSRLVIGGLALAGGAAWGKPVPPSHEQDEAGIKATLAELSAAWGKHDVKAFSAVFVDDAVMMNPHGDVRRGRAEIEHLFNEDIGPTGPLKDTQSPHTLTWWRPIAPGHALVDSDSEMTGLKDAQGKPFVVKTHVTMLMVKRADRWAISDFRAFFTPKPMMKRPGIMAQRCGRIANRKTPTATPERPV